MTETSNAPILGPVRLTPPVAADPPATAEPFSVLLPVWAGDRPEWLRRAFDSTVVEQWLRPDQVVIVRDGPVPDETARALDEITRTSPVPVTRVDLAHNGGLGPALDLGLAACRFDLVARMDADDVAMPHRFATQLPLLADADIVGAGLLEFDGDVDEVVGRRVPPVDPARIAAYARMHDPFNHPTVIYRRSAVVAAGGYGDLPLMEDYGLFARMLANGSRARNVAEPLVYYRVGAAAYQRRGGLELLRSELRLQREFLRQGFVSRAQYTRNVVLRGGYRLVPWRVRRAAYRAIVAPYTARRGTPAAVVPTGRTSRP